MAKSSAFCWTAEGAGRARSSASSCFSYRQHRQNVSAIRLMTRMLKNDDRYHHVLLVPFLLDVFVSSMDVLDVYRADPA